MNSNSMNNDSINDDFMGNNTMSYNMDDILKTALAPRDLPPQ